MPPARGPHEEAYTPPAPRPGIIGSALFASRVLLWLLWLLAVLPLFLIWRIFTPHRVWPRIYFKGFCAIMGLRLRIHGTPARGALLLPNHISWMDTPALLAATGTAFVANDGLARIKALKLLASMNDTVFIARHRRSTIGNQVDDVRKAISDTGALTIFVEGTTTTGESLLPFKSALLSAIEPLPEGLVVQPVWLTYAEGAAVSWVGDEPGLDNVKRMLGRLRPIHLDLHFLDPLSGEALNDRKSMASAARAAIAVRMGADQCP